MYGRYRVRFDADVLEALKALGKGWHTRVNTILRQRCWNSVGDVVCHSAIGFMPPAQRFRQ